MNLERIVGGVHEVSGMGVDQLHERILELVAPNDDVLDVGCGLATYHEKLIQKVGDRGVFMIDAHLPYIKDRESRFTERAFIRHGDARTYLPELRKKVAEPHFWNVAIAIDFLEHLTEADAHAVVEHMTTLAKTVAVLVPEGNHPQDADVYGLGGDYWQTHRSVWTADQLKRLGFQHVERWLDFHAWAAHKGCDPHALWAVWRHT